MRNKLIESIINLIETITEEEKAILHQKLAEKEVIKSEVKPKERHFQETATPEEWVKAYKHRHNKGTLHPNQVPVLHTKHKLPQHPVLLLAK